MKTSMHSVAGLAALLLLLASARPTWAFYDSAVQRWINRDPIGEADGPNVYAFVGNHPTGEVDSSGLFAAGQGGGNAGSTVVWDPVTHRWVVLPTGGSTGPGNLAPCSLPNAPACPPGKTQTRIVARSCGGGGGKFEVCALIEKCDPIATATGGSGSGGVPMPIYGWVTVSTSCGPCDYMILSHPKPAFAPTQAPNNHLSLLGI